MKEIVLFALLAVIVAAVLVLMHDILTLRTRDDMTRSLTRQLVHEMELIKTQTEANRRQLVTLCAQLEAEQEPEEVTVSGR